MADLAEPHVSWDEVLELARRIDRVETGDTRLGLELARLVKRFHAQTVGAPPKSGTGPPPKSGTGRTTPP